MNTRLRRRLDIAVPVLLGALLMLALLVFAFVRDAGADELDPAGELTVTHIEFTGGGVAYLAGNNGTAVTYMAATFHVPNPDLWFDDQTLSDSRLVPPGPFDFELICEPGAAQVDLYIEGQEGAVAADITLDCGGTPTTTTIVTTTTTTTTAPVVVPAPTVLTGGSEQADEAAAVATDASAVAVSSGQERPDVAPTTASPAPAPTPPASVGVLAATVSRDELPNTGAAEVAVMVGAAVLLLTFGLGLIHLPHRIRKH
jgi:hypothetical protein